MGRFVQLASGMILNVDQIAVMQVYRHENGSVRHIRFWISGAPHNDSYELSHDDADVLLDFLKENGLLAAYEARESR